MKIAPHSPDRTIAAPRSRTKVAVLIGALEVGGAERDVARIFPRLDPDQFELVVLEFNHEGPLAAGLRSQGVEVVSRRLPDAYDASRSQGVLRESLERIASLVWVVARLRSIRPDITHSFLPHAYAYQMVGGALSRCRASTVMSRLSLNFYRADQPLLSWLERHVFHHRVDAAVGNACIIGDELLAEGVSRDRVHVIYNGVDPSDFKQSAETRRSVRDALGIASDAFVMLAVGNLHSYKGYADLIEACGLAGERLPQSWVLLIAGRDESGNASRYGDLASERGLGDRVRLLGPREDVSRLMTAADMFVQASHHEGLPNALIEAMSSSLPVVATSVGGIPEAVAAASAASAPAEVTGWLVPAHNPAALADALADAGSDFGRLRLYGENARRRALDRFSLERTVSELGALYGGLV